MVAPKGKTPTIEAAQADLTAATAVLEKLDGQQGDAVKSADTYRAWQADRTSAQTEVDRLSKLIEQIETDAFAQAETARSEAFAKRVATQQTRIQAVAKRLADEGGRLVASLVEIERDVLQAEIETAALNAELERRGMEHLVGPDRLARWNEPASREVVSERLIELWCFRNGNLVGDQDGVVTLPDGLGDLASGLERSVRCYRRKFKEVEYRAAEERRRFIPLHQLVRLPGFDGKPDLVPHDAATPAQVLRMLEQRGKPTEREIVTEFIPVEPWVEPPGERASAFSRGGNF